MQTGQVAQPLVTSGGQVVQQVHVIPGAQVQPGTTVYVQSGPPIASACNQTYDGLRGRSVMILSGLQLGIGIFSIVFNIVGIVLHAYIAQMGYGIWCGVFFVLAAPFGLWAGKSRTLCPIITFMVLSITAAAMTTPLLSLAAIGVAGEQYNYYFGKYVYIPYTTISPRITTTSRYGYSSYYGYDYYGHGYYEYHYDTKGLGARQAMNAVLIFLACFEAVVAIVSACFCCHGVCCCRTQGTVLTNQGQTVQYVTQPAGHPVVMIQGAAGSQPGVVYQQTAGFHDQSVTPQQFQAGLPSAPAYSAQPPPDANPHQPPDFGGKSSPPPSYDAEFTQI